MLLYISIYSQSDHPHLIWVVVRLSLRALLHCQPPNQCCPCLFYIICYTLILFSGVPIMNIAGWLARTFVEFLMSHLTSLAVEENWKMSVDRPRLKSPQKRKGYWCQKRPWVRNFVIIYFKPWLNSSTYKETTNCLPGAQKHVNKLGKICYLISRNLFLFLCRLFSKKKQPWWDEIQKLHLRGACYNNFIYYKVFVYWPLFLNV